MGNVSAVEENSDYGRVGFSEEQADLLDVAINFCREKSPIATVRSLLESDTGFDSEIWTEICNLGWLGIAIPEEYDGVGLSLAEVVPVVEQMGRSMMASPFVSTTLAAQAILVGGTATQKTDVLGKIVGGQTASLALHETSGNWDLTKISARAGLQNGKIKLRGQKQLVFDGKYSNWIIASVLLDDVPSFVMIERDKISEDAWRRETVIDETKRAFALSLDGIELEESAILDPDLAQRTFAHIQLTANLLSAAEMCGAAKAVIDYTIEYLQTRKQFGKVIGSYQALKHPVVDAFIQYEQARSHLYSAANCFNEQGTGEIAIRMAAVTADTALSYASDRSIQFHGGFGFTYDCDAQLYRRKAILHVSLYGDAAYHRKKLAELLF